ncbi:MAG: hypothetical protein AAFY71_11790 [Bacteroidota bacterium]
MSRITCIGLILISILMGCDSTLTDTELEALNQDEIEAYVAANGLQGDYTSNGVFVAILDTGEFELQIDTLLQLDSVFVDTFYLDTTIVDSITRIDTILVDTQLVEVKVPDSSLVRNFPATSDTVFLSFDMFNLSDQLIASTNGEIFMVNDTTYPTVNDLMDGMVEGVRMIAKNGRAIILVPSQEAYGRGGNGDVGENENIRVDVLLQEIID